MEEKIKMSEFAPATEAKDTDEIIILQDGINKRLKSPIFEQKVIDKVGDGFLRKDSKIPNENLTFGKVAEGDVNVISGGSVYNITKWLDSVYLNRGKEYPLVGYLKDEFWNVNNERVKDCLLNIEIVSWDNNYDFTIGAVFKNDPTFGYGFRITRIHKTTKVIGHVYITTKGSLNRATSDSIDSMGKMSKSTAQRVIVETDVFNHFKAYVSIDVNQHDFTKIVLAENPNYDFSNFKFVDIVYNREVESAVNDNQISVYNTFKEALIAKQKGIIKVGSTLAENSVSNVIYNEGNFKPSNVYNQYRTFSNNNLPTNTSSQFIDFKDESGAVARLKYFIGEYAYFGNANFLYRTKQELNDYDITKDNYKYEKIKMPVNFPDEQISSNGKLESVIPLQNGELLIEVRNGIKENESDTDSQRRVQLYKTNGLKKVIPTNENGMLVFDISEIVTKVWEYYGGTNTNTKFGTTVNVVGNVVAICPYGAGKTGLMFISRDYGETWKTIFNMGIENPQFKVPYSNTYGAWPKPENLVPPMPADMWTRGGNTNSHVHGCAYDQYMDRFWVCTGDALNYFEGRTAIWYTDNDGENWTRLQVRGTETLDSSYGLQAMGIFITKNNVFFTSDSATDGVYRWNRGVKDELPILEPAYWHNDKREDILKVIGSGMVELNNGAIAFVFHPNKETRHDAGFVTYSPDGLLFKEVYKDEESDEMQGQNWLITWGSYIQKDRFGNIYVINRGRKSIKLIS